MDLMSLKNMTIEYNQEIKNNEGEKKEEKKEGRGRINKIKGKIHSMMICLISQMETRIKTDLKLLFSN